MTNRIKNITEPKFGKFSGINVVVQNGQMSVNTPDGQTRITRHKDFVVQGGTKEHHERLQEIATKFVENLHKKGKTVHDIGVREGYSRLIETINNIK